MLPFIPQQLHMATCNGRTPRGVSPARNADALLLFDFTVFDFSFQTAYLQPEVFPKHNGTQFASSSQAGLITVGIDVSSDFVGSMGVVPKHDGQITTAGRDSSISDR